MTEAPEQNAPDGAVSRVSLLPVVCSNRVSLRKPTLILTLEFKTEKSFHLERIHYFSCSPRQGLRRQRNCSLTDLPSSRTDTLHGVHAVVWHIRLYQSLCYRRFANVNVGTDTAVRETRCTMKVVALVLQSVIRGRGVARTQVANGEAGHFHTKIVFIIR